MPPDAMMILRCCRLMPRCHYMPRHAAIRALRYYATLRRYCRLRYAIALPRLLRLMITLRFRLHDYCAIAYAAAAV